MWKARMKKPDSRRGAAASAGGDSEGVKEVLKCFDEERQALLQRIEQLEKRLASRDSSTRAAGSAAGDLRKSHAARVATMRAAADGLRAQLAEAEEGRRVAETALVATQQREAALRNELTEARGDASGHRVTLQREAAELTDRNVALQRELASALRASTTAQDSAAALEDELSRVRATSSAKLARLNARASALQQKLDSDDTVSALRQELTDAKMTIKALRVEAGAAEDERQREREAAAARLQEAKDEAEDHKRAVQAMQAMVEEVRADKHKAQLASDRATAEADRLRADLERARLAFEGAAQEAGDREAAESARVETLRTERDQWRARSRDEGVKADSALAALARAEAAAAEMREALQAAEARATEGDRRLADAIAGKAEASSMAEVLTRDALSHERDMARLAEQAAAADKSRDELADQLEAQRSRAIELERQLATVTEELSRATDGTDVKILRRQLEDEQRKSSMWETEGHALKDAMDPLRAAVTSLRKQRDELVQVVDALTVSNGEQSNLLAEMQRERAAALRAAEEERGKAEVQAGHIVALRKEADEHIAVIESLAKERAMQANFIAGITGGGGGGGFSGAAAMPMGVSDAHTTYAIDRIGGGGGATASGPPWAGGAVAPPHNTTGNVPAPAAGGHGGGPATVSAAGATMTPSPLFPHVAALSGYTGGASSAVPPPSAAGLAARADANDSVAAYASTRKEA